MCADDAPHDKGSARVKSHHPKNLLCGLQILHGRLPLLLKCIHQGVCQLGGAGLGLGVPPVLWLGLGVRVGPLGLLRLIVLCGWEVLLKLLPKQGWGGRVKAQGMGAFWSLCGSAHSLQCS